MAINTPGRNNYYDPLKRPGQFGSSPVNPGPAQPAPATTAPSPMAGYVEKQTQARLQPQPASAPVAPVIPQAGPAPKAGAAGSTLQDPGQLTDAGRAYAARVAQNLQGNNPLVQNAQATEDTAAARRAYSARKSATETLAQTPYSPGSAQYQRAMSETQAGVDAANQAGRNQVNAVTRQATADAMAAASGLEDQQYGRAIGERTNSQLQATQLANSIQDPKAKYAMQRAIAAGADPQEAFRAIVGETGTIAEQYRGQSPVETVRQDAVDWIKATQPSLVEGSPEFVAAVAKRMQSVDSAQNAPVSSANKEETKARLLEKIRAGETLSEDEQTEAIKTGAIPEFTASNLGGYKDQKVADLVGKPISIEGKVYTVVQGSRTTTNPGSNFARHKDWTEVKDSSGNYWYVYDGRLNKEPPKGKTAAKLRGAK